MVDFLKLPVYSSSSELALCQEQKNLRFFPFSFWIRAVKTECHGLDRGRKIFAVFATEAAFRSKTALENQIRV